MSRPRRLRLSYKTPGWWLAVFGGIVALSFVLPGWPSLLALAAWFLIDGAATLSHVADKRIAHVSGSALVTWRVPWTPGLVLAYVVAVAELVGAVGLVLWVLLW